MRRNNFDLIRLLAALEVVIGHTVEFLELDVPRVLEPAYTVMRWFPGVPIFFAMSGYLLAKSLERNPDILGYARNRALRIFPGLWLCVSGTLVLLAAAGLLFQLPPAKLIAFVAAQLTIGQSWAPDVIGEYGLKRPLTPNSALWTIRVEIGFYMALPVLLLGGAKIFRKKVALDLALATVAVTSFVMHSAWIKPGLDESGFPLVVRLLVDSPAPFIWLFLVGVLIQRHEAAVRQILHNQGLVWLGIFLVARTTVWMLFEFGETEFSNPGRWALGIANLLLVAPAFAFAFSEFPVLKKLAPPVDISYGVYLWHMILVGLLVQWNLPTNIVGGLLVVIGSLIAGYLSWTFVEGPALRFKHSPVRATPVTPVESLPN